ncbi:MAG TPA: nitrilase-related carbon-nitrogen hydrolase [Symbiobacteriaceae bacterium]|nr:nitrilase-related carbon-nitrogen hydrolase [Symbiobacteriaceae bacterium]
MQEDRWSYLWLILGALCLLFSNGKWIVPLAAWLAPLLLIRFLRTQPAGRGLLIGALVHGPIFYVWYVDVIPAGLVPGGLAGFVAFMALMSLIPLFPYAIDRWLSGRLPGFAGTLIFPLSTVALEFANAMLNPMGGWGSLAFTQTDNLPLLQVVSVTGMYGISFLIAWFAGVGNWAWAAGMDWRRVGRGILLYGMVLSLVLLGGGLRLALWSPVMASGRMDGAVERKANRGTAFFPPETATVRVASLSGFDYRYEGEPFTPDDARHIDALFEATVREARAGARIVSWAEASAMIDARDEAALVRRAAEVAKQESIYLQISPYFEPAGERAVNKSILLTPEGEVGWEYWKSRANLLEGTVPGDGNVARADTPYGRLAGAICWDMDFPNYIIQAGRAGADIMLAPSADWRQIDPMHALIARVRAVENGVSLVRHARGGLSAVYDYQGRTLAAVDDFVTTVDRTMVAQVPVHGVRTIYAAVGDLFAWLNVGALALVVGTALRQRRGYVRS